MLRLVLEVVSARQILGGSVEDLLSDRADEAREPAPRNSGLDSRHAESSNSDTARIFVSVGKRDNVSAQTLQRRAGSRRHSSRRHRFRHRQGQSHVPRRRIGSRRLGAHRPEVGERWAARSRAPRWRGPADADGKAAPGGGAGQPVCGRFSWSALGTHGTLTVLKPDPPAPEEQYTDIAWALSQGLSQGELLPMLERLAGSAPRGGVHYIYAKRLLAGTLVREHPFRAARLAREVLEFQDDDRAHAVLGLSHMLLGHFRLAERARRAALRLAPHSPWYAHNLGHLLDVALEKPTEAVRLLAQARKALPMNPRSPAPTRMPSCEAGIWCEPGKSFWPRSTGTRRERPTFWHAGKPRVRPLAPPSWLLRLGRRLAPTAVGCPCRGGCSRSLYANEGRAARSPPFSRSLRVPLSPEHRTRRRPRTHHGPACDD